MKLRAATVGVLLLGALPLLAGEQPSPHFTGNPRVDFFGSRLILNNTLPALSDSPLLQMTSTPSGEEKTPVVAGLLSLAVPGLGEVYSKSYLKAAAFFAADVVSWIQVYNYNKKGDRQTDAFQAFANQHWNAQRYAEWTLNNIGVLTGGTLARSSYENLVFNSRYDPAVLPPPPFRTIDWGQLNNMERDIGADAPTTGVGNGNGYTHVLPYYGEQQYYELIGKYDEFSRGWDDADLNGPLDPNDPASHEIHNNSQRFIEYQLMRAQANHYYDVAGTWVSVVVVNHVLSALDAFWSATQYNKTLHAEAHMQMQPTQYGFVPFTELKLRYDF